MLRGGRAYVRADRASKLASKQVARCALRVARCALRVARCALRVSDLYMRQKIDGAMRLTVFVRLLTCGDFSHFAEILTLFLIGARIMPTL